MKTPQRQHAAADTVVLRITPVMGDNASSTHGRSWNAARLNGGAQQQPPSSPPPPQGKPLDSAGGRNCCSSRVQPVPLWKARDILLEAVSSGRLLGAAEPGDAEAERGADAVERVFFRRLEVLVDPEELGDTGQAAPLAWFCAQPPPRPSTLGDDSTLPRIFLRTPSDVVSEGDNQESCIAVAGMGAAHVLTGAGRLEDGAWEEASLATSGMRYYGGARFEPLCTAQAASEDNGTQSEKRSKEPSPEWSAFRGHWMVLPLVELSTSHGQGGSNNDHNDNDDTDICDNTSSHTAPTLAVNLRWTTGHGGSSGTTDDFASVCGRATRTLRRIACEYARPGQQAELPLPLAAGREGDPVTNTSGEEYQRWEGGIQRALDDMEDGRYTKVVLARTAKLGFLSNLAPADVLVRLREQYGFLFCLQPDEHSTFLGCAPERLFLSRDNTVVTESLAGTRPRGKTPVEDARLGTELMNSSKDVRENEIVADYVAAALQRAGAGDLECTEAFLKRLTHVQHICRRITAKMPLSATDSTVFYPHTEEQEQHDAVGGAVASPGKCLLAELHPTPAVCGNPRNVTYAAIREMEGFDRGFYAGPVGYISAGASDFCVAIRSALISTGCQEAGVGAATEETGMTLFAGAGIVPGSTASGEWAETGMKMKNFLSLFPPRAVASLRSLPNMNSVWGAMAVEELVRLGVRHFCVCPGSRSTPLAVAIARHPSTVSTSHHDERGAGFYAVGIARAGAGGASSLCAVVTSSGTAVANLLPAACEADAAGLGVLFLTADRPPESRWCGSNQTIDQVGLFGSRARLSIDMQCPQDGVNACTLLSDIDHAVAAALGMGGRRGAVRVGSPGPVHLNFMFRENLAPVPGDIKDASVPGASSSWSDRCLDFPRVRRWECGAAPFTSTFRSMNSGGRVGEQGLDQVVDTLLSARRGMLFFATLVEPAERAAAKHLAMTLGWPVFADVMSGLRAWCYEVGLGVGRLDQMLLDDAVGTSIAPDALLQVGWPLISKRVQEFLSSPSTTLTARVSVICSPLTGWYDPNRGFTTKLVCSTRELAVAVDRAVKDSAPRPYPRSTLLPQLVEVSEEVERAQTDTFRAALISNSKPSQNTQSSTRERTSPQLPPSVIPSQTEEIIPPPLTEPFVAWCLSCCLEDRAGLFLSASMPCRDFDTFANSGGAEDREMSADRFSRVASNRGANGIDGVISSAMGYAAGLEAPVTLLIGDMATLHDLGSLHALTGRHGGGHGWETGGAEVAEDKSMSPKSPITIVCVNNGGGGIFSFLPIADPEHRDAFTPFFDTPHAVSLEGVCHSMGLVYRRATTCHDFRQAYAESQEGPTGQRQHFFIEAVTCREENVAVHSSLGKVAKGAALARLLADKRLGWQFTPAPRRSPILPTTTAMLASTSSTPESALGKPTLLLLHGLMGSKVDWEGEFCRLASADGHAILAVELPGHGSSSQSSPFPHDGVAGGRAHTSFWGLEGVTLTAAAVANVCDAVGAGPYLTVGYSMGGRVALALAGRRPDLLQGGGGLVLVSASPGLKSTNDRMSRWTGDCALATRIARLDRQRPKASASPSSSSSPKSFDTSYVPTVANGIRRLEEYCDNSRASAEIADGFENIETAGSRMAGGHDEETRAFLEKWYAAQLWGKLQTRCPLVYAEMVNRRLTSGFFRPHGQRQQRRHEDLAQTCAGLSVARQPDMWPLLRSLPEDKAVPIVYVAGALDPKYARFSSGSDAGVGQRSSAQGAAAVSSLGSKGKPVAETILSSYRSVRVAEIPECGHAMPTEHPTALYREVSRQVMENRGSASQRGGTRRAGTEPGPVPTPAFGEGMPSLTEFGWKPTAVPLATGMLGARAAPVGGKEVGAPRATNKDPVSNSGKHVVRIMGFQLEEFSIAMTSPLQLSRCRLTERRGLLLRLEGEAAVLPARAGEDVQVVEPEGSGDEVGECEREEEGSLRVWGVGEVTPLPGFHEENLDDCVAQLRAVLPSLVGRAAPFDLAKLEEEADDDTPDVATLAGWLKENIDDAKVPAAAATMTSAGALLPCVQCGIEMALVHLVARVSGTAIGVAMSKGSGILPCRGSIEINSLSARNESSVVGQGAPPIIKVKVGGCADPAADATRALELLRQSSVCGGSSLRLDANQAWSMADALCFSAALAAGVEGGGGGVGTGGEGVAGVSSSEKDDSRTQIEYIEEPLRDPRLLGDFWEKSGRILPYALDESLAMGREVFKDDELTQMRGCGAFVIKLSVVGGLSRAARLCRLAKLAGAKPVISSAFESGVGLAHASILASVFCVQDVAHGLGTYDRLDEDVTSPGFSSAVLKGRVDIVACQALLDRVAPPPVRR